MPNLYAINDNDHRRPRADASTHAAETIEYEHHAIHHGRMYSACAVDSDFDNTDSIVIAFQTPDTTCWAHMVIKASATTFARLDVLEGPTITNGTGSALTPINRNRNSSNLSGMLDAMAAPTPNRLRLGATIAADGTPLHSEMIGAGRTGSGSVSAARGSAEFVLQQNTVYAVRLLGNGVGSDNQIASVELVWYEHVDKN